MNAIVDPMFDPALLAPERIRPLKRREYEQLIDLGAGVSIRLADIPWFIEDDKKPTKKRSRARR